ncbi:MAG: hypothetical protein VYC34_10155 [Planctomycetota bacterium]|nr:hypothetical protein [Planctomycetota bacterium]
MQVILETMTDVLGALVAAAVGSLIGAVLLRAGVRWVTRTQSAAGPDYTALFAMTFASVAAYIAAFIGVVTLAATNPDFLESPTGKALLALILVPLGFLALSALIARRPSFTLRNAALIFLAALALWLATYALVIGIVFAFAALT